MGADHFVECYTDIDAQAALLSGYDQRYQQQGRGAFSGQFSTRYLTDRVTVYLERCNLRLFQQGAVPVGSVCLQFLMSSEAPCLLNGQSFTRDTVLFLNGGWAFDHVAAPNMCVCVIHFPVRLFADLLGESRLPDLFVRDSSVCDRLRSLVRRSGAARSSLSLIDSAADEALADEIVAAAREFVLHYRARRIPARTDRAIYNKALSLIDSQLGSLLRIDDLCGSLGASRRTLENAFSANMGCGPGKFIHLARLNAARRALSCKSPVRKSIADIAADSGLWHGSRFAKDFRELFGQRPHEMRRTTLGRLAPNPMEPTLLA